MSNSDQTYEKKEVRIGIVGIGNMGSSHALNIFQGKVNGARLTAVCDLREERRTWAKGQFKDAVAVFETIENLIDASCVDALIIATPHYDHPVMGIQTLKAGLHVLVEKPIGVYTQAARELNEVAAQSDRVFTIMYNQRTNPVYQKVKMMIESGELGELVRVNWVITDWFRSQRYYDSGGWRATWSGEGGGVLLNQCPHQIDLIQWMCGMPKRVRGFAHVGKFHDIEVEDDVTAYFEYENGASGVFITSTGEAPGTNRLEISGDKGKLIVEKSSIVFYRNVVGTKEYTHTTSEGFKAPENWKCEIPVEGTETSHVGIMQNFVDAIISDKRQLAPGIEGINGLTLSNGIYLSSWLDQWVEFPIDETVFKEHLDRRIRQSKKKDVVDITLNVEGSH